MALASFLASVFSYLTLVSSLCNYDLQTISILARHRYGEGISPFLMKCLVSCLAQSRCLSVKFEPERNDCYHRYSNGSLLPQELVALPTERISSQRITHDGCYGTVCATDEDCRISRTGYPICIARVTTEVPAEPTEMSRCSGPPPSLLNANVSDGPLLIGSVRTYTCRHGYLDTTRETSTAQTRCLENLTWSRVHLKCSGPWLRKQTPSTPYPMYIPLTPEELKQIYVNKSLIFQVKTCNDANFNLGKFSSRGFHSTIIIGGDSNLYVRIKGCPLKDAAYICSCSMYKPFWVRFEDGYISVGKGKSVDQQKIAECRNPAFRVIDVSISSYKNNPGSWLFLKRTD